MRHLLAKVICFSPPIVYTMRFFVHSQIYFNSFSPLTRICLKNLKLDGEIACHINIFKIVMYAKKYKIHGKSQSDIYNKP
jgi:hypothetical protein